MSENSWYRIRYLIFLSTCYYLYGGMSILYGSTQNAIWFINPLMVARQINPGPVLPCLLVWFTFCISWRFPKRCLTPAAWLKTNVRPWLLPHFVILIPQRPLIRGPVLVRQVWGKTALVWPASTWLHLLPPLGFAVWWCTRDNRHMV